MLCQVSFIKNKELNVFFRSLYKNDACFYKKKSSKHAGYFVA